jgi:hypothetical protein
MRKNASVRLFSFLFLSLFFPCPESTQYEVSEVRTPQTLNLGQLSSWSPVYHVTAPSRFGMLPCALIFLDSPQIFQNSIVALVFDAARVKRCPNGSWDTCSFTICSYTISVLPILLWHGFKWWYMWR